MKRASAVLGLCCLPGLAAAEEPLSAIEWLKEPAPITVAQPLIRPLSEPPVTEGVTVPDVTVMPLDSVRADAVGLLPSTTTGLPRSLWAASATDTLVVQLSRISDAPLPAVQALYYTLLLAEADPPDDAAQNVRFLRARIAALRHFGAVDAALALIERAGPATSVLFDDWFDLTLLAGAEDAPCRALAQTPELSNNYANRVFCLAREGDWATAATIYDSARALGSLSPQEAALLQAFLEPEFAGSLSQLPPPRDMTPLVFRLYEANGAPLPTRNLPREYAVADLRGTMGWRAEVEAAERLARTGALPANRLLGLYTDRRPAASGGVWDRVRAVQAFDAAFQADDTAKMATLLPETWNMMRENGLGVAFAALYGEGLNTTQLPQHADLALKIALLSPSYEAASRAPGVQTRQTRFLSGLTQGEPDPTLADTPTEQAIATAFTTTTAPRDFAGPLSEGRLGQVILSIAAQLQSVRPGQTTKLETALATLRLVGMEDVARRAALQVLLLRSSG